MRKNQIALSMHGACACGAGKTAMIPDVNAPQVKKVEVRSNQIRQPPLPTPPPTPPAVKPPRPATVSTAAKMLMKAAGLGGVLMSAPARMALGAGAGALTSLGVAEAARIMSGTKATPAEKRRARRAIALYGASAGALIGAPDGAEAIMGQRSLARSVALSAAVPAGVLAGIGGALKLDSMRDHPTFTQKRASFTSLTAPGGGGGGPKPCLEGFGQEASRSLMKRVQDLKAKMKPGDIVNTDPRRPMGPDRGFKAMSKLFQGTRFGHSAMYDGRGHVIEARGHTVIRRPLIDLARCNEFVVVRPHGVTMADRRLAVSRMRKHIGDDALRVTLGNLVRHGIRPTIASADHEGKMQRIDRALCSSLIANAYAKVPFHPKRSILDHRPVDLLQSDKTTRIGELK